MSVARLGLVVLSLVGCTVDPDPVGARCDGAGDCAAGLRCVRPDGLSDDEPGFCVDGAGLDAGTGDACIVILGPDGCGDGNTDCDDATDEDANFSSPMSCGDCSTTCGGTEPFCAGTGASARCVSGCEGGLTMCGDSCVNVATNTEFCGNCDTACVLGESCVMGTCDCGGAPCTMGAAPECCGGDTCVDTATDQRNCGRCGRSCPLGATCRGGICDCGDGVDCYGLACGLTMNCAG